jgi:large subunit ribosomal protein L21
LYAVIETGGLQYRVEPGMKLSVAKLDTGEGETVSFDKVMLVSGADGVRIGTPLIAHAVVRAKVLSHVRGPKITVFHRKRRKGHEKRTGHRQDLTNVEITEIAGN